MERANRLGICGYVALLAAALLSQKAAAQAPAAAEPPKQFENAHVKEETVDGIKDETLWNASAGGLLSAGNTKQVTINAGTESHLVRGHHGVGGKAVIVYGAADTGTGDYEKNAFNINLKLRYDYLLTYYDALFVAAAYRHDRFAGLDQRFQGQLGYQRHFYRVDLHRVWGEIGYDITIDRVVIDSPVLDATGVQVGTARLFDWVDPVHAGRAYLGYENRLNEAVTLLTGVEVLVNVEEPKDTRVNWDTTVTSKLVGSLSLETGFLLQFDNVPVPGKKKLDTTTKLNLVYTFI